MYSRTTVELSPGVCSNIIERISKGPVSENVHYSYKLTLSLGGVEYMGFVWSGFGSRRWWGGGGDHRCGFSEKLPEASPISNRANTSQLQQTKAEPISNAGEEEGEKMGVKQSP